MKALVRRGRISYAKSFRVVPCLWYQNVGTTSGTIIGTTGGRPRLGEPRVTMPQEAQEKEPDEGAAREGEPAVPAGGLPCLRVSDIERLPEDARWLVEGFISQGSITVMASAPKAGKTWVALALATAVASGTSALGRFHVPFPGPVLVFPAEDDPRALRERIESICLGQRVPFEELPIHIITAHSLQLDVDEQRGKLEALIERIRPKLLILDPLVRIHSGAESYVGHVAELFGYLRRLQRRFELSIFVTHHVSKNRTGAIQPGLAMRGSGDIHASYDHGATLERQEDGSVLLALEHRSAPSPEPLTFRLHSRPDGGVTFEVLDDAVPVEPSPRVMARRHAVPPDVEIHDRVLELVRQSESPVSQVSIRRALLVRNATLTDVLRELEAKGLLEHLGRMKGWRARERRPDEHAQIGEVT